MTGTIRESADDRVFTIVNYIILFIFTITILYPLVYIVSASFSSSSAVVSGKVWLYPVEPTLAGYEAVFKHRLIGSSFLNSVFYTVVGTVINVFITLIAAYPLSRKDFMPRNVIMALFVFTMMFSGGLIPSYLVVKGLGMIDTRWSLIIPGALAVWNMVIARTYFQTTIPDELLEAAQMDGCSDLTFVRKIVIPVSGPIIAVIALFYAVGHWNQYFNALLYLKHQELYPIQLVLRDILVQNEVDASMITDLADQAAKEGLRELLKFSLIVVSTLPVLIIYPFIQRHFVKGMMIGSLKG
ncbi:MULTISPECIES: carbohydrate ABC transporter permease [Paenibacillus]|jgi:putative aldouronate transport system permease protein|uniref:Carbohydrate ABC transporter permease n=1 Tax=Paenibacillus baimaensis TaxID=2982185 RepID=A0ABT2UBP9_9BACL|nr:MULTISPECIES: carbohydrate ABC transporter permease [unclassified Paenibacillus]MCU6792059.1 carbohydrate ABC transporter permease [Paenibacillus sp. WQ 127069]OMF12351.1 sugar ABC transporter permease [Paenibacillus sp. FSL H7-0331]